MKLTPFRIGLFLMAIGSIWTAFVFSNAEKISQDLNLGVRENINLSLDLKGNGLGFYKIMIPNSSREIILVKVLDPHGDVINLKRIETKMSVNYFEFDYGGKYTLEVTNFSENPIQVIAEFGNAETGGITFPTTMAFIGAFFLAWSIYKILKNYSTAHPEENR